MRALLDSQRVRDVLAAMGWTASQERRIDTPDGPLVLAEDSWRTVQQTWRRTWLRFITAYDPFLGDADNRPVVEGVDVHTDYNLGMAMGCFENSEAVGVFRCLVCARPTASRMAAIDHRPKECETCPCGKIATADHLTSGATPPRCGLPRLLRPASWHGLPRGHRRRGPAL